MSTGGIFANEGAIQNTPGNFYTCLIKVCNLGILKLWEKVRPPLDEGPGSNFSGTNLD
jgi:hypothetical protein